MPDAVGVGGAKLILFGEHAVVYGFPALAVGVDRTTTVRVGVQPGPDDPPLPDDPRLLGLLSRMFGDEPLRVTSNVPIGRGMGSSAALAVALVRAQAAAQGEEVDASAVFERSLDIERLFHGNPSGVDNAVADRGGALLYRRGPPAQMTPVACPDLPLVVLDTGRAGDTAQLVAGVARRRPGIDGHLEAIGRLTEQAASCIDDLERLGALMNANQRQLEAIGVSTPELEELIELARQHGALGAKLSGAGGGGVVVALAPQPEPIVEAARQRGIDAFTTRVRPSR